MTPLPIPFMSTFVCVILVCVSMCRGHFLCLRADQVANVVANVNGIYFAQMKLAVFVSDLVIKTSAGGTNGADIWNYQCTSDSYSLSDAMNNFKTWRKATYPNTGATMQHLSNCWSSGSVGLASLECLCLDACVGTNSHTSAFWLTVAHEMGHNFNAPHVWDLDSNGNYAQDFVAQGVRGGVSFFFSCARFCFVVRRVAILSVFRPRHGTLRVRERKGSVLLNAVVGGWCLCLGIMDYANENEIDGVYQGYQFHPLHQNLICAHVNKAMTSTQTVYSGYSRISTSNCFASYTAVCGDGIISGSEACDGVEGNTAFCVNCQEVAVCGDGYVALSQGETCDTGGGDEGFCVGCVLQSGAECDPTTTCCTVGGYLAPTGTAVSHFLSLFPEPHRRKAPPRPSPPPRAHTRLACTWTCLDPATAPA